MREEERESGLKEDKWGWKEMEMNGEGWKEIERDGKRWRWRWMKMNGKE